MLDVLIEHDLNLCLSIGQIENQEENLGDVSVSIVFMCVGRLEERGLCLRDKLGGELYEHGRKCIRRMRSLS